MIDIKKLRKERSDKAAAGKTALAQYNTLGAKADRTEAEEAQLAALGEQLDAIDAEVESLDTQIKAAEKTRDRAKLYESAAEPRPAFSAGRTVGEPGPGKMGFKSMNEFGHAVARAAMNQGIDPRLAHIDPPGLGAAPSNYEQNGGSAGEGFLVPPDYRQEIWQLVFEGTDLIDMCDQVMTNSNSVSMPKDETTPWGASGVTAAWASEASQMTPAKIAMGQITVQLHELRAFVAATAEILADAPRLQNALTIQAARAIRWKASDAVVWGDGNGKPLGFQNAGSLVVVNKESGQAASTIVVANLLKMMSRLFRTGGGSPFWLINPDVMPQLGALTIGNFPAWLPNPQPLTGTPWEGTLLGRPVLFSEHAQSLTTQGDINLIAPDIGYQLLTKQGGGIDFAASIHLWFDFNINAFRWIFRLGGQPYLSAAVSPANGSNTKSHFITLQAR